VTRVVYFGFPVRSHTVPSFALVRNLAERGAAVDYYSTPAWRSQIESAGGRFFPYGVSCDVLGQPAPDMSVEAYAETIAAFAEDLRSSLAGAAREADAVIFDVSAHWGCLAARDAGLPAIAFATTFAFTRPMLQLMRVRDPRHLDILIPSALLSIICTSREYQPVGQAFGDNYIFAGPLIAERPCSGEVISRTGSRPLAYVSLGTLFNRDGELLLRIAGSLSTAGYEVVVATSCDAEWPEHVRSYRFVDQMSALRAADLAVTHAGMASMSEIMSCGIPAIAIPHAVDQFLVARRTESLGAAVMISRDSGIETALGHIRQHEPAMRAAARRIADSFANVTPLGEIAGRILGGVVR
jgi:UDP:flavonoid glycosyltransferase YjiC (YdhE family)